MSPWSALPASFRAILTHTGNCALTVISFRFLFWLAHTGAPGWPLTIMDQTENIVLATVYIYFALILLYDLFEERVRAIIRFLRNQIVLA